MNERFNNGLILMTGCLWGTQGLFMRVLNEYGSSSAYTSFLRLGIGCALLIVITVIKDGPSAFKVSKRTFLSCACLGLVCQAAYNLAYTNAVNSIGVSFSAVLLYSSPVFTSLLSLLLFKETIGKKKWIALAVNIVGCALTVTGGDFSGVSLTSIGLLYGLAATFCYSLTAIFGRIATGDGTPLSVASYNFLFATIFLLFFKPWATVADPLDPRLLAAGFGLALIPTALAYILYFTGVSRIAETSRVPVIASVEIIVATLIGIVFLNESIGVGNWIGIALVFASILIMNGAARDARA